MVSLHQEEKELRQPSNVTLKEDEIWVPRSGPFEGAGEEYLMRRKMENIQARKKFAY